MRPVVQKTASVGSLTGNVRRSPRAVETLALNVDSLSGTVDALAGNVDGLPRDMDAFNGDVDALIFDVETLIFDVSGQTKGSNPLIHSQLRRQPFNQP